MGHYLNQLVGNQRLGGEQPQYDRMALPLWVGTPLKVNGSDARAARVMRAVLFLSAAIIERYGYQNYWINRSRNRFKLRRPLDIG